MFNLLVLVCVLSASYAQILQEGAFAAVQPATAEAIAPIPYAQLLSPAAPLAPVAPVAPVAPIVDIEKCMACICDAATGCVNRGCSGNICGPYSITWAYWSDSALNGKFRSASFESCANDFECSSNSVANYVQRFQQDCDGDGKITCDDLMLVHFLGGYGCKEKLPEPFWSKYQTCKAKLVL
ncbi:unnamed protein product [Brassicogethes aeneus]|uniref:lysozyme n=1 Tax=Brassicogethes aeneus TaxID=1431903 RepID=A0A9P0FHQ1_BRAAE|nr:unnamed protein product [Brassicogethes aeneus]